MHQHDTAFDRVADRRVRPEGNLGAIARREMTEFRQIGEIHVLERVINARHWRRRLAWSAKCNRESEGRHKNGNNNKDGDEKTFHAIGLTRHKISDRPNYLALSPSRKAIDSNSTRTASSIGITGRASKTNAGSIEQNLWTAVGSSQSSII